MSDSRDYKSVLLGDSLPSSDSDSDYCPTGEEEASSQSSQSSQSSESSQSSQSL